MADLLAHTHRFVLFVAGAVALAIVAVVLVVAFPITLASNLYLHDDWRRAWRETLEIYRPPRRRGVR